ncbi:MAG: hypothetical protein Q4C73_09995 [Eubacteriales bacterium]|nr:hypothetical protein [Eubacteriales bacterium]
MRQDRRFQRKGHADEDRRRLLAAAAIPLIVIVLMIIIVVADHIKAASRQEEESATLEELQTENLLEPSAGETETGEGGEEPAAESESQPEETLKKDEIPEILDLMKTYFKAREDSDAETMNQIYGVGEQTGAELEEERTRLRSNAKYVQSFENIATYVMDTETADTWLVYTLYDIRFHSVETAAPMIMWSYIYKDVEGNYRIRSNASLTEEELDFADRANHSEEVRRLASDVNVRLKEALTADQDLNEVYGVLRDGSPVYGEEPTQPEVVVVETTAAPETTRARRETSAETTAAETQETTAPEPSTEPAPETIEAFGSGETTSAAQDPSVVPGGPGGQ